MPFISAAQTELLAARLLPVIQPADGGETAKAIAQVITKWLEEDALPTILVQAGIPVIAGAPPGPGATTGTGTLK